MQSYMENICFYDKILKQKPEQETKQKKNCFCNFYRYYAGD